MNGTGKGGQGMPAQLAWAGVLGAWRATTALEGERLRVSRGCTLLRRHALALVQTHLFL
jgi:hypothetical protein